MRWLWAPRAVWQIVVVSMAAVLTPLTLLLFHTTEVMEQLARQNRMVNEEAIQITESTRNLVSGLIDMERIARQYRIIGDPALLELFRTRLETFEPALKNVGAYMKSQHLATRADMIGEHLNALRSEFARDPVDGEAVDALLGQFAQSQTDLEGLTAGAREELRRAMRLQSEATVIARENVLSTAILLIPVTLGLIVAFTIIIVRPMQHLQASIRRLGNSDPSQGDPVEMKGPYEMMRLGRQLEWLRLRLAEVNEQKQEFLRHISHELKTPLASIREGTQLMKEQVVGDLSHGQREVMNLVDDNSKRLQQMIENLLLMSRSELVSPHVHERFTLLKLGQELLQQHKLTMANHEMTLCLGGPGVTLFMDKRTLHTILDNLLSNAVAYGARGGRIWLEWDETDGFLNIRVANSGEPIAENEQSMIFEPFYQGRHRRQGAVKGSGIGLAVARQCTDNLNGRLHLVEHPKAATCFEVQLPTSLLTPPGER